MYQAIRNKLQALKLSPAQPVRDYHELYEAHALADSGTDVIGVGDFERIGKLELRFLELADLHNTMDVLDFGCGIGRLAKHLVPELRGGSYCGVDISPTMVARARDLISPLGSTHGVACDLHVGDGGLLNSFVGRSFDCVCAFSVFTHMDLEDTFLHFQCIKRVLKEQGTFICSHLLLPESDDAKNVFIQSSAQPYTSRRATVLSVVTSRELIETVAALAGLHVVRWIGANEPQFSNSGEALGALGQAVSFIRHA
jgi:ubiquinone/menaquinone biosynthesis C-methylase UbiE